ncbi:MAG: ABC transporter permease [Coriobacteriales bacterium]|jgi:putative ABC transport system permease protein|nr:ABC transporter permease [Coriobacteriales bacterium]
MLKLILHSIRMRKVQSASVVLTVLVGVAVLFAFSLISLGVQRGVATAQERGGAYFVVVPTNAQSLVSDADLLFTGAPATMYMDKGLVAEAAAIEGVTRVTGQFYSQTLDASCCSALQPTRLIGFDARTDWLIGSLVSDAGTDAGATALAGPLAQGQVILGSKVDGFVDGRGEVLGTAVTVVATLAPSGTDLDSAILIDIDVARQASQQIEGYGHFWEQYGQPSQLVSAILVDVAPGYEDRVAWRLAALGDVKVLERSAVIARAQQQLQTVFNILLGAGLVMAGASLLQLFARFYSMAWDRKNEFALYRALGATRGNLRALIGGEAVLLTVTGVAAGLAAGAVLYGFLLGQLATGDAFPYIAPTALLMFAAGGILALLFLAMAALAVIVPLRRIARIDPSVALQHVDIG